MQVNVHASVFLSFSLSRNVFVYNPYPLFKHKTSYPTVDESLLERYHRVQISGLCGLVSDSFKCEQFCH